MPDDHSALGRGGAHLGIAAGRRRLPDGCPVQLDLPPPLSRGQVFGQAPRYAKDMKVIQLDIAPEEIGHNKATEVALVGDGKAIVGQLNKALAGRSGSIRRTRRGAR